MLWHRCQTEDCDIAIVLHIARCGIPQHGIGALT